MPGVVDTKLVINARLSVPLDEISIRTTTSGGPGGQHANRTESRVVLRFEVANSSLSPTMQARIIERCGPVVEASSSAARSQHANKLAAYVRLGEKLADAVKIDPPRRATKPSKAAKVRRLDAKTQRAKVKDLRKKPVRED